MLFSSKSRYALRVMVDLAENNAEIQSIKNISKRQDISEKYLEQILSSLTKANLVTSKRGTQGGYSLSKPIKEISVGEIMHAAEGDLYVIDCLNPNVPCDRQNVCKTHDYWDKLNSLMSNFLDSVSLYDILNDKVK